jgi:DnaK suppressor protein
MQHGALGILWHLNCGMQRVIQESSSNLEWIRFRAILEARIGDLERAIRRRDGIAVERHADQLDELQQASQRDLEISTLNRESQQLREVRAAVRRITEGSFGVCEQCGEDIHSKRLAAIPWTAFCIQCQEMLDRNRREKQIPICNLLSSSGT